MFLAVFAVITMDRVLGDDGLDLLGNVFDDASAGAVALLQLAAAAGAGGQAMILAGIDLRRRLTARARMAVFGARLLAASLLLPGLEMGGRRRGRGGDRRRGCLHKGQTKAQPATSTPSHAWTVARPSAKR